MASDPKTVILTGASRGIGHSTVSFFSKKNWEVITCSREQPPEECRRDPNWSHHITADLEDGKSLDNFVTEAKGSSLKNHYTPWSTMLDGPLNHRHKNDWDV